MIEGLEEKLEEKDQQVLTLEKQLENLSRVFTLLSVDINNINEAVQMIILPAGNPQPEIKNLPAGSYTSPCVEILKNILNDVQSDSNNFQNSSFIQDHIKRLVDNFSSNLINLINHSINSIGKQNQFKIELENSIQGNLKDKLFKDFQEVSRENQDLKKNSKIIFENGKESIRELNLIKEKFILFEIEKKQLNNRIEELEKLNFNLKRRINTHPSLPYINFEKKMFNKMVEIHECICHVCGEGLKIKIPTPIENKEVEDIVMHNSFSSNNPLIKSDENLIILTNENERLKERLTELHEILERQKLESNLTEEKLVSSKPFKMLLSQAEQLLHLIDSLKELNSELNRQKLELSKEKELEIKAIEQKHLERTQELEGIILEQRKTLEKNKISIGDFQLQTQNLENQLKLKLNEDLDSIFDNFEKERNNSMKQMEIIKSQMKDYENKFDEEFRKNKQLEEALDQATNNSSSIAQTTISTQPELIAHFEKRINKRNDQIRRLENELKTEREYKDAFIQELEANEKGLSDINKKTKALSNQISACNDKIAKMTSDRMKDSETIKKMNEEKEILEKIIKNLEEKIKLQDEVKNKLNQDILNYKEIYTRIEQEVKLKEEEIELLKNEIFKKEKLSEQYRISYDKSIHVIKDLEHAVAKQTSNSEANKIKYEELCKFRNVDGSVIGNSISKLEKDVEELTAVSSKYKVGKNKIKLI